jgi:tRNA(adenine34) deaminase
MEDVDAMRRALAEASEAERAGDVPVGAVVLLDGVEISAGRNEREHRRDPTAHAEINALSAAAAALGRSSLDGCTIVVTLEPCVMCAGAIVESRVTRVVFAAVDEKAGACGSRYNLLADPRLGHEVALTSGLLADEASAQLRSFFASRRG